jgi:hypothetical protein
MRRVNLHRRFGRGGVHACCYPLFVRERAAKALDKQCISRVPRDNHHKVKYLKSLYLDQLEKGVIAVQNKPTKPRLTSAMTSVHDMVLVLKVARAHTAAHQHPHLSIPNLISCCGGSFLPRQLDSA